MTALAVVFGGQSSEYHVSLHSVTSFLKALHKEKYQLHLIGISQQGHFYAFHGTHKEIEDDCWIHSSKPISWCHQGYIEDGIFYPIDVLFPILHGKNGEDGSIQGLAEILNIRYVGCNLLSSALCMDKELMHILCDYYQIPTAPYICVREYEDYQKPSFPLPYVIKPCNAGSSYGVSYVETEEQIMPALFHAWKYDGHGKALIEQAIDGFEIGCALLGGKEVIVGHCDEVEIQTKVFDYDGKYAMKDTKIHCPARISSNIEESAQQLAKKVYRVMQARDMARVDMFVLKNGEVILNEINTIPGFTETSRYPSMMKTIQIDFGDLIDRLILFALERETGIC